MLHQLLLPGFNNLPVNFRREKRSGLSCQVIPNHHHIDDITNLFHKACKIVEPEFQYLVQQCLTESGILQHIHKPSLHSPHIPANLVHHSTYTRGDCIWGILLKGQYLFPDTLKPVRITSIRKGIPGYVLNGGISQGMVADIHIELLFVRHGPNNAEFVSQIVPELPVAEILTNGSVKIFGSFCRHIPNIHLKHFQNLFTGPDQLLHRIEHHNLLFFSQVLEQFEVSFLVNSRLKSTQIDRNTIRSLKIESCKNPFA